jgi:hypothetical protein
MIVYNIYEKRILNFENHLSKIFRTKKKNKNRFLFIEHFLKVEILIVKKLKYIEKNLKKLHIKLIKLKQ